MQNTRKELDKRRQVLPGVCTSEIEIRSFVVNMLHDSW